MISAFSGVISTVPHQPNAPVRNPYSSGSITGSAGSSSAFGAAGAAGAAMASQLKENNPYAAPKAEENPFAAPRAEENPYAAKPVQNQSNPYAVPVEIPPIVNPYAAPKAESPAPTVASNPYARPIGTVAPQKPEAETPAPENATRRRATRMQRYHAAEESDNNENA